MLTRRITAIVVLATLAAPLGAAAVPSATAERLVFAADVRQVGSAGVLKAYDPGTGTSLATLTLHASRAIVETWEITGTRVGGSEGQELPPLGDQRPQVSTYRQVQLSTAATPSAFAVQALGQGSVGLHLDGRLPGGGEAQGLANAFIDGHEIRESRSGDADSPADVWTFTRRGVPGPHVLSVSENGGNATLRGEMLLEFRGFILSGSSQAGPVTLRGDEEVYPMTGGQAAYALVQGYTHRFVRLHLEGARVEFSVGPTGESIIQWAAPSLRVQTSGPVSVDGAAGEFRGQTLAGRAELTGPIEMDLQSQGQTLALAPVAQPSSGVFMPAALRKPLTWMGMAGLGALLALAGVLAVRRREPTLESIETALEAGDYDRAARLSARLVKRRPTLEGARISRAIALTKAGQPKQVVDELEAYLAVSVPTDGVMHYVLGMAYLDFGDESAARRAFREAAARTPSLLDEIDPRLAPRRDGDAQAYA